MSSIINKLYNSYNSYNESESNVYANTELLKDSSKEHCVLCNEVTDYKKNDSVQKRTGYVEGCGQFCNKCDLKLERLYMDRELYYSFLY